DPYTSELASRYRFLQAKHELTSLHNAVKHGGMRPVNFPSVRLAQFANLYHTHPALFDELMHAETPDALRRLLQAGTSPYWDDHYLPGKQGKPRKKRLGRSFIDGLILNVVIPLRFAYYRQLGRHDDALRTADMAAALPPEDNQVVRLFTRAGLPVTHAGASQAVLRLYESYCKADNCLNCTVGKIVVARENDR
ncbi:MAG: DUF2851 family protein, partial [Chlorobi bacterium]|nr:DUF2851 family protein [Chlorobiota bacterium]